MRTLILVTALLGLHSLCAANITITIQPPADIDITDSSFEDSKAAVAECVESPLCLANKKQHSITCTGDEKKLVTHFCQRRMRASLAKLWKNKVSVQIQNSSSAPGPGTAQPAIHPKLQGNFKAPAAALSRLPTQQQVCYDNNTRPQALIVKERPAAPVLGTRQAQHADVPTAPAKKGFKPKPVPLPLAKTAPEQLLNQDAERQWVTEVLCGETCTLRPSLKDPHGPDTLSNYDLKSLRKLTQARVEMAKIILALGRRPNSDRQKLTEHVLARPQKLPSLAACQKKPGLLWLRASITVAAKEAFVHPKDVGHRDHYVNGPPAGPNEHPATNAHHQAVPAHNNPDITADWPYDYEGDIDKSYCQLRNGRYHNRKECIYFYKSRIWKKT